MEEKLFKLFWIGTLILIPITIYYNKILYLALITATLSLLFIITGTIKYKLKNKLRNERFV